MRVYNSLEHIVDKPAVSLAVGTFDGLHLAHRQILEAIKNLSLETSTTSLITSFSSHPQFTLKKGNTDLKLLMLSWEKVAALRLLGLEMLVLLPFDRRIAQLGPDEFILYLLQKVSIKNVVVGPNHFFGKDKAGDFSTLRRLASKHDFAVHRLNEVLVDGNRVSSTLIRDLIQNARVAEANRLLGYTYHLSGLVIYGQQVGRKLGFPTANLEVAKLKLVPQDACYAVFASVRNKIYQGMMYIGNRPTLNGLTHNVEVNIFDFDADIYGETITVYVVDYLRPATKFHSLDALVQQLHRDRIHSRELLRNASIISF